MDKYNSTNYNAEVVVDLANKRGWFSLPLDKKGLFNKVIIPSLFVFISYKLGWTYGFAYLAVIIFLNKLNNVKANNFSQKIFGMSHNNSSQFNQNPMLVPQNQNFQYPSRFPWSLVERHAPPFESTVFGPEQIPPQVYIKIPNVTELKEEIKKEIITELKNELLGQQIILIQFLESEKIELKQPISVSLSHSIESGIWIVDCPELNLYGEGKDENQAIDDFKVVLEEFYFNLKKDKENLGPELKKKWDRLQQIVQEK